MQNFKYSASDYILYLEGRLNPDDRTVDASIETYISLFCLSYCNNYNIRLHVVQSGSGAWPFSIPISVVEKFNVEFFDENSNTPKLHCKIPVISSGVDNFCIGGLCSVLRWTIKMLMEHEKNSPAESLLGFRGSCLAACSESSMWTKFCEVELPTAAKKMTPPTVKDGKSISIPQCLVKLESHLKHPVRTHNITKRKLDILKTVASETRAQNGDSLTDSIPKTESEDCILQAVSRLSLINEKSELDHCFLEGIDLTLADVIALPCVHFLLQVLPKCTAHCLPHVLKWYNNMLSLQRASELASVFSWNIHVPDPLNSPLFPCSHKEKVCKEGNDLKSLYSRSPQHTKIKCKTFDPSDLINCVKDNNVVPHYEDYSCDQIHWDKLPAALHPSEGELPKNRIQRKCQQLESIVGIVRKIAKPGQTIVDFCSGGGHVGLLLAHFLPSCQIFLVENKEESMFRARVRASSLGLKNIMFFQCNMDYFTSHFDIGVCLHACGVATDLTIEKCINEGADFVCCPCCYGRIQNTGDLSYPLSSALQSKLSYQEFCLLARCADRTELNTAKEQQGIYCMGLIDMDRKLYATERGYAVLLTTLQPPTCSTKHNLLVGQKL